MGDPGDKKALIGGLEHGAAGIAEAGSAQVTGSKNFLGASVDVERGGEFQVIGDGVDLILSNALRVHPRHGIEVITPESDQGDSVVESNIRRDWNHLIGTGISDVLVEKEESDVIGVVDRSGAVSQNVRR